MKFSVLRWFVPSLFALSCAVGQTSTPYWNWRNPQPHGNDFSAVTRGGGLFVAVGSGGSIDGSTDGQTWSAALSGITGELSSIAYGNGRFVVLGYGLGGGVLTSTDGRTWIRPAVQVPADWAKATRIAFGAGRFVAVGSLGFVASSADGVTWAAASSGTSQSFSAVAFGGNRFVALADGGGTVSSADGLLWTVGTNAGTGTINGRLAYGGGLWLALSARYAPDSVGTVVATSVATSADGATWITRPDLSYQLMFETVGFFQGRFYAWGSALPLLSSTDGAVWQANVPASTSTTFQPRALAASDDRLVMAGRFGTLQSSADGSTWTSATNSTVNGDLRGAAFGAGRWIVAGTSGLATSADAVSWAMLASGMAYNAGAVAFGNDRFVATANDGGIGVSSDGGETWTRSATIPSVMHRVVFGNGVFVGMIDSVHTSTRTFEGGLSSSVDGVAWSPAYALTNGYWRDVAFVDGTFIAIGLKGTNETTVVVRSTDGLNWTVTGEFDQTAQSVGGRLGLYVVAGLQGDIWTSPDALSWTHQGQPLVAAGAPSALVAIGDQLVGPTFFGKIVSSDNGKDWAVDDYSGSGMMWSIATGGDQVIAMGNAGAIWQAGTARFVNNATRARVSGGSGTLIMGFVISGTKTKTLLVRGVGPALADYQVPDALSAPTLTVFDTIATKALASNTGWRNGADPAALVAAAQQVGAFALKDTSADSALLVTLPPGIYSANVTSGKTDGVALVEVYEVGANPSRIVNMSTRANVGTGADVLIPGLVIGGDAPRTLLVRAVGPTLATFGVDHALAQPQLLLLSGTTTLATNQGWSTNPNAADIAKAAQRVGAFSLPSASADSALLVKVNPGIYSLQVRGVGDTSGVALVEVYEVP